MLILPVRFIGAVALWGLRFFGAVGLVSARTLLHLPRLDVRELARALVLFGYRSLPLTLGAATLIGATAVMQTSVYASQFGVRLYVGWAAGFALVWKFGPLLLGLIMAARIGARNAAELALLTVNGQMEGLRGISLDPFRILVAPRVVASALCVLALASVTFLVGIIWESGGRLLHAAPAAARLPRVFEFMLRWAIWWVASAKRRPSASPSRSSPRRRGCGRAVARRAWAGPRRPPSSPAARPSLRSTSSSPPGCRGSSAHEQRPAPRRRPGAAAGPVREERAA